jgi:flagellar motor protein MotB
LIEPDLGFRSALGYEYRGFRFGIESGYTNITGTNPLVLNFQFIPLVFKTGYNAELFHGFGVQADLSLGYLFSNTLHYSSALDMLMENKQESHTNSLFSGGVFYATYTFNPGLIKIYLGGGVNVILERDGVIPLPVFEAGVSLKPFLFNTLKDKNEHQSDIIEYLLIEPPPESLASEQVYEDIVKEETEQEIMIRHLSVVFFEPDSTTLIERYRLIMDEAAEILKTNPNLTVLLRGYAAPFGRAEILMSLSFERAKYCAEYLIRNHDISLERIIIEYYGSERTPELADVSWESFRCVELIIEPAIKKE